MRRAIQGRPGLRPRPPAPSRVTAETISPDASEATSRLIPLTRPTSENPPRVTARRTTAAVAANPQFTSWVIWDSMSMAIMESRRPPSMAGVI